MVECVATPERKEKLKPFVNQCNNHGDTRKLDGVSCNNMEES